MKEFEFLKDAYLEWYIDKVIPHIDKQEISDSILKKLKMTRDDYYQFQDVFNRLSIPEIRELLNSIAFFLQRFGTSPYTVNIDLKIENRLNALQWTQIFIYHLKFFDIKITQMPYNQCHICGKPNSYTLKKVNATGKEYKKEYKFNQKRFFCHAETCRNMSDDKNYTAHKDCCYGKLEKIRHDKRQYYKGKKLTQEEKIQDFKKLCDEIYEWYLKNSEYTIQCLDKDGNLIKAVHKSDWQEEIMPMEEFIKRYDNGDFKGLLD